MEGKTTVSTTGGKKKKKQRSGCGSRDGFGLLLWTHQIQIGRPATEKKMSAFQSVPMGATSFVSLLGIPHCPEELWQNYHFSGHQGPMKMSCIPCTLKKLPPEGIC